MLVIAAYVMIMVLPLVVLLVFPMPTGRDFWRDFSVALGFVGLSIAGFQFIPTARLQFLADVFDMDHIYKVHHYLSMLSIFLVLLHPMILVVNNPYTLYLLNPFTAPWRAQAGIIGLAGLLLIAITSVLRKEVKLGYNSWHLIHDVLALAIAIFALVHIFKVNYYSAVPIVKAALIFQAFLWVVMTLYIRVIKPIKIMRKPYEVQKIIPEAADTWTIVLKPVGHEGLDFNPAQVAWININSSPFVLHRNPFSISGSAHKKGELRFSIKALGDFSSSIGLLKGGERVYVDGPFGSLTLNDRRSKRGFVLLAGGIGAAPVMSILYTLADNRDKRKIYFFYGSYDKENIIFRKELEKLKQKLDMELIHVLEVPSKGFKSEVGFITRELLEKILPTNRQELFYFVCGPLPMIEAMEDHLMAMQIPDKQVTVEKYEMA